MTEPKTDETKRTVHRDGLAAMEAYLEQFKGLVEADGWMAAIWEIRDGRLQLTRLTTHCFPLEDRLTAERQLAEVNALEIQRVFAPLPPPPLDLAPHLRVSDLDSLPDGPVSKQADMILCDPPENDNGEQSSVSPFKPEHKPPKLVADELPPYPPPQPLPQPDSDPPEADAAIADEQKKQFNTPGGFPDLNLFHTKEGSD